MDYYSDLFGYNVIIKVQIAHSLCIGTVSTTLEIFSNILALKYLRMICKLTALLEFIGLLQNFMQEFL